MTFETYVQYLERDQHCPHELIDQTIIREHMLDNVKWIFIFNTFFLSLYGVSPYLYFIMNFLLSKKKRTLKETSYEFIGSWIFTLVHHATVVPLGIYWIYMDYYNKPTLPCVTDYAYHFKDMFWVLNYVFSYMTVDFLVNLKDKQYIYCFHHGLILFLCYSIMSLSGPLIRFIPHFFICESSGIVFNIAWFLRDFGYEETILNRTVEVLFAILFFTTRILNFIPVLYLIWSISISPFISVVIFPLFALQLFWFTKILKALAKKFLKRQCDKIQ